MPQDCLEPRGNRGFSTEPASANLLDRRYEYLLDRVLAILGCQAIVASRSEECFSVQLMEKVRRLFISVGDPLSEIPVLILN